MSQVGNFAVERASEEELLLDKLVLLHQQDLADPAPEEVQHFIIAHGMDLMGLWQPQA